MVTSPTAIFEFRILVAVPVTANSLPAEGGRFLGWVLTVPGGGKRCPELGSASLEMDALGMT